MAKYHITAKGEPGVCRATSKPCPLGSDDKHYDSPEAAREAYEKEQKEATFAPPKSKAQESYPGITPVKRSELSQATKSKMAQEWQKLGEEEQEDGGNPNARAEWVDKKAYAATSLAESISDRNYDASGDPYGRHHIAETAEWTELVEDYTQRLAEETEAYRLQGNPTTEAQHKAFDSFIENRKIVGDSVSALEAARDQERVAEVAAALRLTPGQVQDVLSAGQDIYFSRTHKGLPKDRLTLDQVAADPNAHRELREIEMSKEQMREIFTYASRYSNYSSK